MVTSAGSEGTTQGYMSAACGFAEAAAPIVAGGPTGSTGPAAPRAPLPQASVFISNPFEGAWSIRGSGDHGGPTLASSHSSGAADSDPILNPDPNPNPSPNFTLSQTSTGLQPRLRR